MLNIFIIGIEKYFTGKSTGSRLNLNSRLVCWYVYDDVSAVTLPPSVLCTLVRCYYQTF